MGEVTTTGYMILGMLSEREYSAYELVEQVARGVTEVWRRADRQLYDTPKKLVELGLATARTEPSGERRTRTVYSITEAGRRALAQWLATETQRSTMEFEGLMRVLFADGGTVEDLRANLLAVARQAHERRELFRAYAGVIAETGGTMPSREHLFALANRYMVDHFTTMVDWATWALEQVESWTDTDSPAAHHDATVEVLTKINRMRPRLPPGLAPG